MRYLIQRECWNDNTYNGYVDNPYWRIKFRGYEVGLRDDGTFWNIKPDNKQTESQKEFIKQQLRTICKECKLSIKIV